MSEPRPEHPDDVIGIDEASRLLEVPLEQVRTMVATGMLTTCDAGDTPRFRRGAVLAARELGG